MKARRLCSFQRPAAEGLEPTDVNGLADPYVKVHPELGHATSSPILSTTCKPKTLAPNWEGEELRVSVPHFRCWRESIESSHLFLVVHDRDRFTHDDTMGGAVLHCAGLFEESNGAPQPLRCKREGQPFAVPLRKRGQPAGVLKGNLRAELKQELGNNANVRFSNLRLPTFLRSWSLTEVPGASKSTQAANEKPPVGLGGERSQTVGNILKLPHHANIFSV